MLLGPRTCPARELCNAVQIYGCLNRPVRLHVHVHVHVLLRQFSLWAELNSVSER